MLPQEPGGQSSSRPPPARGPQTALGRAGWTTPSHVEQVPPRRIYVGAACLTWGLVNLGSVAWWTSSRPELPEILNQQYQAAALHTHRSQYPASNGNRPATRRPSSLFFEQPHLQASAAGGWKNISLKNSPFGRKKPRDYEKKNAEICQKTAWAAQERSRRVGGGWRQTPQVHSAWKCRLCRLRRGAPLTRLRRHPVRTGQQGPTPAERQRPVDTGC